METQYMGQESKQKCRSLNVFELNDYQFKTSTYRSTYMNPMVTTNQKPTIYTQKLDIREHKYISNENCKL